MGMSKKQKKKSKFYYRKFLKNQKNLNIVKEG